VPNLSSGLGKIFFAIAPAQTNGRAVGPHVSFLFVFPARWAGLGKESELRPCATSGVRLLPFRRRLDNDILGAKVLDGFLLFSIDETGKKDQHLLPRLHNEFHERLDNSVSPRQSLSSGDMQSCVADLVTDQGFSPFRCKQLIGHCRCRNERRLG